MRPNIRRGVTLLAIYAVALHVILLGLIPIGAAGASVDPFSIICHSATGTAGDEAPVKPGLIAGHACKHCNLCSVVAPPPAPDIALAGSMGSARLLHVLCPVSAAPAASIAFRPNLARGPPRVV